LRAWRERGWKRERRVLAEVREEGREKDEREEKKRKKTEQKRSTNWPYFRYDETISFLTFSLFRIKRYS
jgi:hypothetical protein